jgi:hypothetical protein
MIRRRYSAGYGGWVCGMGILLLAFSPTSSTETGQLQSAERESDYQILAGVVRSTFALLRQDRSREDSAVGLMFNALAKADEFTLHAALEIFAFYGSELSPSIIDVLLPHLEKVTSANTRALRNIDHGISYQLEKGEPEQPFVYWRICSSLILANSR